MFNADLVDDYINGVKAHGYRNPIVPISSLATQFTGARIDAFIAYSVIPVSANGKLASDATTVQFVAMPHVFKRKNQGCGDRIDPELAKQARLVVDGFGPKRGTPTDLWPAAMATARMQAEDLLERIVPVYGLPDGPAPTGESVVARRVALPTHPAQDTSLRPGAIVLEPPAPAPPTDSDDFFYYLLAKVSAAFEKSDICAYQRREGLEWWFAVCALPLRRNTNLLTGLKWGVDPQALHHPQAAPPAAAEVADVASWRFIARSRPFLERHVAPFSGFNYLNVCPFRAPKLTYLTNRDWQLAIDHFFVEAIDYLKPPMTVIIGTTDVKVLAERGLVDYEPVKVRMEGKTETGYRGVIHGKVAKHRFGAVPQPTYAMTNAARDAVWAEVFK